MTTSHDDDDLLRLELQAAALSASVGRINEDIGDQVAKLSHVAKRNRRLIKALAASFALDILLTIGLAFGFVQLGHTSDELNAVQKVAQREALCPLFEIFMQARSEEGKARSTLSPEEYDRAYDRIENGYHAMKCGDI
jgi:hypothetical protein